MAEPLKTEEPPANDRWIELQTESGKSYYYNAARKVTQWEKPEGDIIDSLELQKKQKDKTDKSEKVERKTMSRRKSFQDVLKSAGERIIHKKEQRSTNRANDGDVEARFAESPLPKTRSPFVNGSEESGQQQRRKTESSQKRRSLKKDSRKWVKKKAATFGDEEDSEFYYVNENGETQWERPEDYESDDEIERREERQEICFDTNEGVEAILIELGAIGAEDQSTESEIDIVRDRDEMLRSGEDIDHRCEKRLRQIFLAMKYCGGPEEWEEVLSRDDWALVRNVYLHWGEADSTPPQVRSIACLLLETFEQLNPNLIMFYSSGEWGLSQVDFLQNIEHGLQEGKEDGLPLFSWLSIFYNFLTEVPSLPREALPSSGTVQLLLTLMSIKDEDEFIMATYVLLSLNSHLGFSDQLSPPDRLETGNEDISEIASDDPNEVVQVVIQDGRNGELFSEAVLHLLNDQSYPYNNVVLLGQVLYFVRCVFSTRASASFFHTMDLRVMIDIILVQVKNLPLEDEFRCDYLRILQLVLLNASEWRKYRHDDIFEAVDWVVQSANQGMHPLASKIAIRILLDCVSVLH